MVSAEKTFDKFNLRRVKASLVIQSQLYEAIKLSTINTPPSQPDSQIIFTGKPPPNGQHNEILSEINQRARNGHSTARPANKSENESQCVVRPV
jgi:hypothetical protein